MLRDEPSTNQDYAPGTYPDLPPPVKTTGAIGWIRKNLFSSPANILLTILGIALIWFTIPPILEWVAFNSIWTADSRKECWEKMASPGQGACWAFIRNRINLFIYGFYPEAERWRVDLSFILLIVAVVPILFDKTPGRKYGLIYAAAFPFIAAWLLKGDSSIFSFFALLILFLVPPVAGLQGRKFRWWWYFVYYGIFWFLIDFVFSLLSGFELPIVDSDQFGGIMLTIVLGVTGISFSLPIGIVLALGRTSHFPVLKMICVIFIEFIRGVPLITLLFIASTMLNYFLPPGTHFDLLMRVLIMVTLFASGYIAEVIRGALQGIPKGQFEAADSLGLKYWQAMWLIILPQALKISIPGIVNTFIALFKDTTLVLIIGMLDILGLGRTSLSDADWAGLANEVYLFVAFFFWICCFSMSRYSLYLEKKLNTGL